MKYDLLGRYAPATAVFVLIAGTPATALAYVGPGAGLSIIGSLLAFLAAIVIGIFGFLWFPIRRMLRKRKLAAEGANSEEGAGDEQVPEQAADENRQGDGDA